MQLLEGKNDGNDQKVIKKKIRFPPKVNEEYRSLFSPLWEINVTNKQKKNMGKEQSKRRIHRT